MRMWMINPVLLCKDHLLGEHNELHKHLPSFRKGHRVDGRFSPIVQMQFQGYAARHDALAQEILRRGWNHKSPLTNVPDFRSIYPQYWEKKVDLRESMLDLSSRCNKCLT